jgi:hypothetical protein
MPRDMTPLTSQPFRPRYCARRCSERLTSSRAPFTSGAELEPSYGAATPGWAIGTLARLQIWGPKHPKYIARVLGVPPAIDLCRKNSDLQDIVFPRDDGIKDRGQ